MNSFVFFLEISLPPKEQTLREKFLKIVHQDLCYMYYFLKLNMGQDQNGHLYIKYRSSFQKNKAEKLAVRFTGYFSLLF